MGSRWLIFAAVLQLVIFSGQSWAQTYEYDELDRVTRVVSNGKEVTFSYDAAGNRTATVSAALPPTCGFGPELVPVMGGFLWLHRRRQRRRRTTPLSIRSARVLLLAVLVGAPTMVEGSPGLIAPDMGDPSTLYNGYNGPVPPRTFGPEGAGAGAGAGGVPHPGSAVEVTPEIAELARALRNDVDLIFEYVHNQIEFDPVFGSHKGAMGALLDKSGGDMAQASLMIALLRASGYTANYVWGTLRYTPAEVENWLGLTTSPAFPVGNWVITSNRYPFSPWNVVATSDGTPQGDLDYLDLERVWVEVEIDGTMYHFDPSFKQNVRHTGIDLAAAMGYSQSAFLSNARAGAAITATSAQNLNAANIDSDLSTYAHNLLDEIEQNHQGATLTEIVGGAKIVPLDGSPSRVTALPNLQILHNTWTDEIDDFFRPCLRVSLPGLDETFYSDSLSGKRLTIFYGAGSFPSPVLRLDGATVATGFGALAGTNQSLVLETIYPDGGSIEQSGTASILSGGSYLVLNGWTRIGRGSIEHHKKRHLRNQYLSGSPFESVLGESLAVIAATWLAEREALVRLAARISDVETFVYHAVGVVGQASGVSIDVPVSASNFSSLDGDPTTSNKVFIGAAGGHGSVFEGGVVEQLMPVDAVSTVELAGVANDQGETFYELTSANFSSLQPQLALTYSTADMNLIQNDVSPPQNGTVILPNNGSLVVNSWTGAGFLSIIPTTGGYQLGHRISGGLKGGFSTFPYIYDPLYAELYQLDSGSHALSFDPIDLVTGDFLFASTDLTVGSAPYPLGLGFTKTYNSGRRFQDGPLGLGWTHSFDVRATEGSDGFVALGEGAPRNAVAALAEVVVALDLAEFTASVDTWVIKMLAHRWFMEQLTSNTVTVTGPDRSAVFVRLPDGSYGPPPGSADALSVEPDGSYRFTTKHGDEFDYDLDGRIESWQDPNGNTVVYTYSGDQLQRVDDAAGHALIFGYTDDRITSVSDGARSYIYGYDGVGNLTTMTDANSKVTTFDYVDDGLLSEIFTPANPTQARVSNTYSALDRVETQLDTNGQLWTYYIGGNRSEEVDPRSHSKINYYDQNGRTLREIDALGFETSFEYDGEERLVRSTQPEENYTEYEHDERHNITRVTQHPKPGSPLAPIVREYYYHPNWNLVSYALDPRSNGIEYSWNGQRNLYFIQTHFGVVSKYFYNSRGQVRTHIDGDFVGSWFTYDPTTADLLTITRYDPDHDVVTTLAYNAVGDLTSVTDPRGNTVVMTPDDMRRVTQIQAPAPFNYLTRFDYDDDGNPTLQERQMGSPVPWQTTTTTYTVSGRVETETEPGAAAPTTTNQYDELDRLWRVTDANQRVTEHRYDARGNLSSVWDATSVKSQEYTYTPNGLLESIRDANGNVTSYRYDGFDRLEFTDFPDQTFTQLGYDASSNITSRRNRAGETILYGYDEMNRLVLKDLPGSSPDVTFDYERSSRLYEVVDGAGATRFSYDDMGRRASVTDPNGRVISYNYDAAGNRSQLTYPDGSFVTYEYDELDRLEFVRDQGTTLVATFGYDELSRRDSASYANGTSTSYGYEIDDDVSSVVHQLNVGTAPTFNYTYDAVHNRKTTVTAAPYVFDLLSILPTTYTANGMNQYTTVVEDGVSNSPSYDLNGNLLTPPSGHSYVFDAENRLVTATTASHALTFEYDAFGMRKRKTVDGVGTEYVLDGNQVVAEYDDSGSLQRKYVYAGLDNPIRMLRGATAYFYHQDASGSVAALSNASGALAESYAYSPYGRVSAPSGPGIGNPYLYAGREFDTETGLYYNRARFYDPVLGRFLHPDPIGLVDSLNLYAYVGGNPVNFVDPLGLFAYPGSQGNLAGGLLGLLGVTDAQLTALQLGLAGAGAVPALGIGPDLVNVGLDLLAGDLGAAAIDGAAAVPGYGLAAAPLAVGVRAADGTYDALRQAGLKDAHHIIQDAAVREVPGYSRGAAPAVQLHGPSTRVGSPHYNATQVQRQAGGGTYASERRIGYKALRRGGLSPGEARAAIQQADAYFGSIGVTPSTVLRRPGNRP